MVFHRQSLVDMDYFSFNNCLYVLCNESILVHNNVNIVINRKCRLASFVLSTTNDSSFFPFSINTFINAPADNSVNDDMEAAASPFFTVLHFLTCLLCCCSCS